MKAETVVADDLTKGEHVDGEEEGSQHRALRYAMVDWGRGGTGVSDGDKLFSVCEVELKPGESRTGEAKVVR